MGLLKKIFKPVAKVLDKVIPNEIKPALPYLAAFAPVFAPAGIQSLLGQTMMRRAITSGGLNILGQFFSFTLVLFNKTNPGLKHKIVESM